MIDVIVADLDSTVANCQHREHLAPEDRSDTQNWIEYSKACIGDAPVLGVVAALRLYKKAGFPIFYVSGRNIEAYEETLQWLHEYDIPVDVIKLHSQFDIRNNAQYKAAYLLELRSQGYNPVLMFEDHETVSLAIEEIGIPTVTVRPRYEDNVGVAFNALESSIA